MRVITTTSIAVFSLAIQCCGVLSIRSQSQSPPSQTPPSSGAAASAPKTTAQRVGLLVYPKWKQDAALQSKDETECYNSAKEQSGINPADLASSTQKGGAVKGGAGGAAGGAAIGAIAGDAGTGAAIGATAGAIRGRRQP